MRNIPARRFYQQPLILLKTGEGCSYKLAQHFGNDGDARIDVAKQCPGYQESPRTAQQPGINIPLETRDQTIFSYRVSADVKAILNGQNPPQVKSRKETMHGIKIIDRGTK
jgi:hypothetical protein